MLGTPASITTFAFSRYNNQLTCELSHLATVSKETDLRILLISVVIVVVIVIAMVIEMLLVIKMVIVRLIAVNGNSSNICNFKIQLTKIEIVIVIVTLICPKCRSSNVYTVCSC